MRKDIPPVCKKWIYISVIDTICKVGNGAPISSSFIYQWHLWGRQWCTNLYINGICEVGNGATKLRSSNNGSACYWPPGLLHTLGAGGHVIEQKDWFLHGVKFFALNIFWRTCTYNQVYVWCCKHAKNITVKDVTINNYELLNIQACSFLMFWNRGCTQSLVVSCKYWVVPLISTRVSGKSQVILLPNRYDGLVILFTELNSLATGRCSLKSKLVWAMAWCCQAANHYLHQCGRLKFQGTRWLHKGQMG